MAADRRGLQRPDVHRLDRCPGDAGPGFLAGELTRPENAAIARQLDAAISGGLRPTTLILHHQPHSKWERWDFALFEAHAIWKAETSSSTGYPLWLTRSLDPAVGWMVEETTDQADAVLDAWDKEHTERTPGMSRHVVPIAIEGSSVPIVGGLAREHHFLLNAALATGAPPDDESAGLDIDRIRPAGGWDAAAYG